MLKYHRISEGFMPSGVEMGLDEDSIVSAALDEKLQRFLTEQKALRHRIINAETVIVPETSFAPGYFMVCLHLEYEA